MPLKIELPLRRHVGMPPYGCGTDMKKARCELQRAIHYSVRSWLERRFRRRRSLGFSVAFS